jgi:hypothetical protein
MTERVAAVIALVASIGASAQDFPAHDRAIPPTGVLRRAAAAEAVRLASAQASSQPPKQGNWASRYATRVGLFGGAVAGAAILGPKCANPGPGEIGYPVIYGAFGALLLGAVGGVVGAVIAAIAR